MKKEKEILIAPFELKFRLIKEILIGPFELRLKSNLEYKIIIKISLFFSILCAGLKSWSMTVLQSGNTL